MEDDVERSGRGLILRYFPGTHLKGLRKTIKVFSQESRSPGKDLNKELPKAGVLTIRSRR
jgi:hypothetical protein